MKNLFDTIVRTPGVLMMSILMIAFVTNAAVEYRDATGFHGPYLLAAMGLVFGQVAVIGINLVRKYSGKASLA